MLAVSTLAVSTGEVMVQDNESPKKDIMKASMTAEFVITGEEGSRSMTNKQSATIEMQGDYINEDKSGVPYVWQCTEDDNEGEVATQADCVVIRMEREKRDDGTFSVGVRIQEYRVDIAVHKMSDAVAARQSSPDQYFDALVTAGKATKGGESEAMGKEGSPLVVRATDTPISAKFDLSKTSVGEKTSTAAVQEVLDA